MIRKSLPKDAFFLAFLHQQNISKGFLSKLGTRFLEELYSYLIKNELVLVYEEKNQIFGFISCTLS